MTKANTERRNSVRLPLRAYAELSHGSVRFEAHVLDISGQGVRIALLKAHPIDPGDDFTLVLEPESLPDRLSKHLPLTLKARAVHVLHHIIGAHCEPLQASDAERYRRLLTEF